MRTIINVSLVNGIDNMQLNYTISAGPLVFGRDNEYNNNKWSNCELISNL